MDIKVNIDEKEIEEMIQRAIDRHVDDVISRLAREAYNLRGFDILTEKLTLLLVEYAPKYFEENNDLIIDRAAQRLIEAFSLKNADIVRALIALSEDRVNE